jgi:hypothetical protein
VLRSSGVCPERDVNIAKSGKSILLTREAIFMMKEDVTSDDVRQAIANVKHPARVCKNRK